MSEGPDDGHTFRITFDSRGSYSVVGDEHHTDAPDFHGVPHVVEVRAWNLRDALRKAANLPFDVLMGTEATTASPKNVAATLADELDAWCMGHCRACYDAEFGKTHSHDCGITRREIVDRLRNG